jgi:hypothetical protein
MEGSDVDLVASSITFAKRTTVSRRAVAGDPEARRSACQAGWNPGSGSGSEASTLPVSASPVCRRLWRALPVGSCCFADQQ